MGNILEIKPIEVFLETGAEIDANEMKEILDKCGNMLKVSIVPDRVKKLLKKYQLRQVFIDGKEYEYMLNNEAYKKAFGEISNESDIKAHLIKEGFGVAPKDGLYAIFKNNNKIAKYKPLAGWLQLHPDTKSIDIKLIYSFPSIYTIFLKDYSINSGKLKELLFCGHKEIDFKYWEKEE